MENNNSVCFIAKINEVRAIEGADNIELVIAGGWNAITKKGEFKEGSLTIIATTDAVIPEKLSEKMGVANYLRKGTRVRTVKLKGTYSECLIIPIIYAKSSSIKEGKDLMEELGITKYEPPVKQIQLASGKTRKCRENLDFGVYYKFPNLKNVTGMFTEEDEVQITRKLHGTSSRYGILKKVELTLYDRIKLFLNSKLGIGGDSWKWCGYEFYIGSHNVVKDIQSLGSRVGKGSSKTHFYSTDVWSTIAEKYDIKNKLWTMVKLYGAKYIGEGIILYGEIYGAGIQKNYEYGLEEIQFVGFDVKVNGEYQPVDSAYSSIVLMLGLPHVETLYTGNWNQEIQDSFVFNNFIEGTKTPHEGIVIKHISGDRKKVAKVINPDYLIYGEKNDVGDSH